MNSNIALYCIATDNIKNYSNITSKSKIEYCEKHGYRYFEYDNLDSCRPPAWSHLLAAKLIFENNKDIDIVFRVDADAMIMNYNIKVEDIIEEYVDDISKYSCIITRDCNSLNTGVFMFLRTPNIINIIDEMWNNTKWISHQWWEQMSLIEYYESHLDELCVIPQRVMNSYTQEHINAGVKAEHVYQPGDFIVHTPGLANREQFFINMSNQIIR